MIKQLLTNFAWVDDDNSLHIDVPRMLEALGVEDTVENREELAQIAGGHLAKLLRNTPAVIKITE